MARADDDLAHLTRDQLIAEVVRLRAGIRAHRDSSGDDLCWHHLQLWGLLPEPIPQKLLVPDWPQFLRGASGTARRSTGNCLMLCGPKMSSSAPVRRTRGRH